MLKLGSAIPHNVTIACFKARAKIHLTTRQLTMTKKTKQLSKMTNQILIILKMKKNLKGKIDHFVVLNSSSTIGKMVYLCVGKICFNCLLIKTVFSTRSADFQIQLPGNLTFIPPFDHISLWVCQEIQ